MAKLHEEIVVIKISKLIKENDNSEVYLTNNEFCSAIEQVAQELLGSGVIVELEKIEND